MAADNPSYVNPARFAETKPEQVLVDAWAGAGYDVPPEHLITLARIAIKALTPEVLAELLVDSVPPADIVSDPEMMSPLHGGKEPGSID